MDLGTILGLAVLVVVLLLWLVQHWPKREDEPDPLIREHELDNACLKRNKRNVPDPTATE